VSSLSIDARQTDTGIEISLRGSKFVVKYPKGIWGDYPKDARDILFDNLVYAETVHLPLTLRRGEIRYNISPPSSRPSFSRT